MPLGNMGSTWQESHFLLTHYYPFINGIFGPSFATVSSTLYCFPDSGTHLQPLSSLSTSYCDTDKDNGIITVLKGILTKRQIGKENVKEVKTPLKAEKMAYLVNCFLCKH